MSNNVFLHRHGRLILGLLMALILILGLMVFGRDTAPSFSRTNKQIKIMSSISLQWGEASIDNLAQGKAKPSRFFSYVARRHRVSAADDFKGLKSGQPDLLILVQPRLFEPAELIVLDNWVQAGGRVLIFADPALQWPTDYSLGDSRRPLFTSFLSPITKRWGLELTLPADEGDAAMGTSILGGNRVAIISEGAWLHYKSPDSIGQCEISHNGLLADCNIGEGRGIFIADADLLQDALWQEENNAAAIDALLHSLLSDKKLPEIFWDNQG